MKDLVAKTHEGATTYGHSLDNALEFFSKAGSMRPNSSPFYSEEMSIVRLFKMAWEDYDEIAMKLLLWLRDCRGGAGNRSGFRECLNWLGDTETEWITCNITWIPTVGRWDDLRALFGTASQEIAVRLWANTLLSDKPESILAAKWANRKDKPLRNALMMNEAKFRKFLAYKRKEHIVEYKMCSKNWNEINYEHVPSVAMSRYTNAFKKNDTERFEEYKESLKKGKVTVHSDVLFPHDCVRTVKHGDAEIAEAQFNALPNFLEGTDENIIVISDTSGSMAKAISGSVQAVDVSQALALYCSAKIPKDNPFHKKFIAFCSEGELKSWEDKTFAEAVRDRNIFDGAVGSTRIDLALKTLLKYARKHQVKEIPSVILIVSDMQFSEGVFNEESAKYYSYPAFTKYYNYTDTITAITDSITPVEKCMDEWEDAGFPRPKIIYWNTDGYAGSPAQADQNNVALVSGFSTGILKAILAGEDFNPKAVMLKTLEKYKVENPIFDGLEI